MIYSVRVSAKSEEWSQEAIEGTRGVVRYFKEHYPEIETEMLNSMTGEMFRVAVINKFKSLVELQAWGEKIGNDEGFKSLLSKMRKEAQGKSYTLGSPVRELWKVDEG